MRHPIGLPLALLVLGACGRGPTEPEGTPALLTQLPRPLSSAEHRIVDGANAFSFDLLREATRALPSDSNAFLSPLSASMALGMTLNGASGETFEMMQTALRLAGMTEGEINLGYRDLIALLGGLDSRTEMVIANSMWGREGFPLAEAFTTAGRTYFDAEINTLDFGSPDAVGTINDWVSGKTNQRIPALLDEISGEEVLFLINAIYFKGKWRHPFDPNDTESGSFHAADGRDRGARLMRLEETLKYQENDDFQAVDLLYGNGAFSMTVLLPKPGRAPVEALAGLEPAAWQALADGFQEEQVNLALPRFRLEYTRRLKDDLEALGMAVAFDPHRADFYRIADIRPEQLYITRVDQKTFVEVNEEGTEAAAATAVGVGTTSAPQVIEMRVDRPFVFAIRERLSGAVIFLGVMNVVGE
ncbi:MAG: serpin family protein [Gemmatimonadales bacterium]|nr:serpin family protein [Gemmatimonadales bacterium]